MPPSYNIGNLPFEIEGPLHRPTKEQHGLFETVSIISSRRSSASIPPSAIFRGKRLILLGLGLSLSFFLVLLGLALQIFVLHEFAQRGDEIITAAPLGSILAIVHGLSVLLIFTLPFVVGLLGYSLAWSWLKASVDNGHDRPTPFQLGIIMNILNAASPSALYSALKYMYGIGGEKRTSYKPRILRRAIFTLAFSLALVYSFVGLDIALSVLSTTMAFSQVNGYRGTWPQLSRAINSSMCATTSGAVAPGVNLCGLQTATGSPFSSALPEALATLTNNSASNAVAFGDDGTAFLVPVSIPQDIAYYGTSMGVFSSCQSITAQCIGAGPTYGPANALTLSCPATSPFNATLNATTNAYPFGVLDLNGNQLASPYLVDSNPFQFGGVVLSQAYSSDADTFVGKTGFFTHETIAYNVLTCSVTVRSVTYAYFNGTFIVDPSATETVSNLDITRGVGAMTAAAYLYDRVPAAVEGAGLRGDASEYASAFGRELSRELIAFTASIYQPADVQDLQSVTPVLGSKLPLPLLALLLLWIIIYCIFIFILTVAAVRASSASPYTLLATARLRAPLTAVHTAYARAEAHRTWECMPQRLFSAETGLDRLNVGPTTSTAGGLAFGVTRSIVVPTASREVSSH